MSTPALFISLRGDAEVRKMLDAMTGQQQQNRVRKGLRAGAKIMREALRAKARAQGRPKSFQKTRTRSHRNPLGVSVSPQSPLSNIFEHGAKRHSIGKAGQLLYNPEAQFIARGAVSHPGVAAIPLIVPTFEANEQKAMEAFRKALFEGVAK